MNKKGFTLLEVLCVTVILALIATIASSSIMNLSKKSKENMYCTKLKLIESYAEKYAQKHEKELNESTNKYNGYKSIRIKINDLVTSGILTPDKENTVINPLDDSALNDTQIIIYLKDNNIYTYIDSNNICEK